MRRSARQLSWLQTLPAATKMMADLESIEEPAVIGNTDITTPESENNIVNTVVFFIFLDNLLV